MKLIDNFIREPELLDQLLKDEIWETLPEDTGWYLGWWRHYPTTVWHHLIQKIWATLPKVHDVKGFEYWSNNLK